METTTENGVPAVKQSSEVSTEVKVLGGAEGLTSRDTIATKIFHQQSTSDLVKAKQAEDGDFCDSVTGEVLVKKDKPLRILILLTYINIQTLKEQPNGKFKYHSTEAQTAENANFEYEYEENGENYRRRLQYNYFCMVEGYLDELPFVLSLTSTKVKVARKMNTLMMKMTAANLPSWARYFELHNVLEKNDEGSWYGLNVIRSKDPVSAETQNLCEKWYRRIKSSGLAVAADPEETGHGSEHEEAPPF